VWLIDIAREVTTRFTFHRGLDGHPVWSSDGTRVVFGSQRNGPPDLFEKAASAAGDDRLLLASAEPKMALSWSSDGQWLLYSNKHPKTGLDLLATPMANDGKPIPVIQTTFDETAGQFSPDGRWVAFQSNKSGTVQIYVEPFRGPGAGWQVTTAGGSQPRWRPDGKELFYLAADTRLMAVPTLVGPDRQTPEPGATVPLFRTRLASGPGINSAGDGARAQYAVASDGRRFLMNMAVEESLPITVVLNWDAALK
jgi:Tol biopolymer transport system component